jgi:hypothetical protein
VDHADEYIKMSNTPPTSPLLTIPAEIRQIIWKTTIPERVRLDVYSPCDEDSWPHSPYDVVVTGEEVEAEAEAVNCKVVDINTDFNFPVLSTLLVNRRIHSEVHPYHKQPVQLALHHLQHSDALLSQLSVKQLEFIVDIRLIIPWRCGDNINSKSTSRFTAMQRYVSNLLHDFWADVAHLDISISRNRYRCAANVSKAVVPQDVEASTAAADVMRVWEEDPLLGSPMICMCQGTTEIMMDINHDGIATWIASNPPH